MTQSGRVTWIGHSTVQIELDGASILTDPLLRTRVVHLRRLVPLGMVNLEPDAVLVSHAHWDHLDLRSLDLLAHAAPVVVPRGVGHLVSKRGFTNVVELSEGERITIGATEVRATAASHHVEGWMRGTGSDALGFIVEGSRSIYFAGDTDLFDGMASLGTNLDVALLPVSGWGPRLPPGHLDPQRAADALSLIQPRVAIPIHWGTYAPVTTRRAAEAAAAPDDFRQRAAMLAPAVEIRVLGFGESTVL